MILFITIVIIFFVFSIKRPDFMFWLAVIIYHDPGGYIRVYLLNRSMIGGLQVTDLTFILLLLPLLSPKVKIAEYFKFKDKQAL